MPSRALKLAVGTTTDLNELSGKDANGRSLYAWRPPDHLRGELPDDFSIAFRCITVSDGFRGFSFSQGAQLGNLLAAQAGLAILAHERKLDRDSRNNLRAAMLCFQYVQRMQQHSSRKFISSRDLFLRQSGRPNDAERSALPDYVGQGTDGNGQTWSVKRLTTYGRELAIENGIASPTNKAAIPYGLLAAAKRCPHRLSAKGARNYVRRALYDLDNFPAKPDRKLLQQVRRRLNCLIGAHLNDTTDQFNKWFFPGKSNLPKAIANLSGSQGGCLLLADVKNALLHLGWQAYSDVAKCIKAFMTCFLQSLRKPLDQSELRRFKFLFFPQPAFGGLPMTMLMERGDVLKPFLNCYWQAPTSREAIGTLHTLLRMVGDIIALRREADRRAKSRSAQDRVRPASSNRRTDMVFKHVAEIIATREQLDCRYCGGDWGANADLEASSEEGQLVVLDVSCSCSRIQRTISMPRDAFARMASLSMEN